MKITKYLLMGLSVVAFSSCLDTEPLGDVVTSDQKSTAVEQNPERLSAAVSAITSNFYQYSAIWSEDDNQQNDFGYPAIMMILDSRGTDMVCHNVGYNWFRGALAYTDNRSTSDDTREIWSTLYNQIYTCNAVTATVDSATTDATLQYDLGQALAVRAFDYFTLAQLYQKTYSQVDPASVSGVPIITEKNSNEVATAGCPRGTLKQTYDQILSDLDRAIDALDKSESNGVARPDKRYVSSAVAHGLRARVYLVMNKWSEAEKDADYAIQNGGATPKSRAEASVPSFNSLSENDWLWGIKTSETDRVVTTGISNFPSMMGSLSYGYVSGTGGVVSKRINLKLYDKISATDARKNWFLDGNGVGATLTAEQQNYATSNGLLPYTQVKYAPYKGSVGTSTNSSDIPLMRVEEMYLIKAEAQAMAGDPAAGAATLTSFVRTYRDPEFTLSATSAADVQKAVYLQRRIELWGEGFSYLDNLRLNTGIDRRGGGYDTNDVFNIPAGDPVLLFQIPESEYEYNKQITSAEQNTPGSVPTAVPDE